MISATGQLNNLRLSLLRTKMSLTRQINIIDRLLKELGDVKSTDTNRCINCKSKNVRFNKNEIFCRNCGTYTPREKLGMGEKHD